MCVCAVPPFFFVKFFCKEDGDATCCFCFCVLLVKWWLRVSVYDAVDAVLVWDTAVS